ncbi:MAG: cyclic nucleotide-binding domain-containing protein [Desulfovibrionaceae bacterium]|nr:cyclic nucleotide-binding domain-containing protein [Desulfovibrionaceae bacterium]MBF0513034.1 cyclic nucleotide-binding domain-containing protein [Desulfovibrionaceae bacterium]
MAGQGVAWDQIALFAGLGAEEIERIEPIFERQRFAAGKQVIGEGEPGEEMFILIAGSVRVSKAMVISGMAIPGLDPAKSRKVLATLDAASYPMFGEMALIDSDIRSASVAAVEESEFLVTGRERFFDLVHREPAVGCKLLAAISRRMAATVRKNNVELIKLTTALALALSRR